MDEGRSASQKPEPSKTGRSLKEQEPSLFLLLSRQRVLRPEFPDQNQDRPPEDRPSAPVGKGAPWVPKAQAEKVGNDFFGGDCEPGWQRAHARSKAA